MRDSFETIWTRIVAHAGQQFQTRTGQVFRYEIIGGDRVRPTVSENSVSRTELAQYYSEIEHASTAKIAVLNSGPSFIWSILTDHRIAGR